MDVYSILTEHHESLCLFVGNGVNRYPVSQQSENSWKKLLAKLWEKHGNLQLNSIPDGISLTEFYDALDLTKKEKAKTDLSDEKRSKNSSVSLQKEFCNLMDVWKPTRAHTLITEWARKQEVPILTTNFESTLSDATGASLRRLGKDPFTDYYPWNSYYSNSEIHRPDKGFSIWHVNGMQRYHRSVRLGLTHYMGSVHRARSWIHRGGSRRLFNGKSHENWKGKNTWLHCIFNNDILIFGLGLEKDEVFIRWLLVERAKYFKKYAKRRRRAWFVDTGNKSQEGRDLLLRSLGITPLTVPDYSDIYEPFS